MLSGSASFQVARNSSYALRLATPPVLAMASTAMPEMLAMVQKNVGRRPVSCGRHLCGTKTSTEPVEKKQAEVVATH